MRFFTGQQVRTAEENAVSMGMSWLRLMENAGAAAGRVIREHFTVQGKKAVVVCGQGNNGGDGYVVARKLHESGASVTIIRATGKPLTENALEMSNRAVDLSIRMIDYAENQSEAALIISKADIIIDALFGTGFHGVPTGFSGELIEFMNAAKGKTISLDLPSGTTCDTGKVEGAAVEADITVGFTALKPCHVIYPAADFCGQVITVTIGMPDEATAGINTTMHSMDLEDVKPLMNKRNRNSNKGDYGKALLICGSYGMAGAAAISAEAAIRTGVGLAQLAVPKSIYPIIAGRLSEPVYFPLDQTAEGTLSLSCLPILKNKLSGCTAALIGCGLSAGMDIEQIVTELLLSANCPLVLDADGINALNGRIDIIKQVKAPLVLTPHPGEMARLLNISIGEVEANRVDLAKSFAIENRIVLLLKGAHTIVACPDGQVYVNLTGNPGLATAGSGDMLAGMIVSLLAQGVPADKAAAMAAWLHGTAGDRAASKKSQRAITPTDMLSELPYLFNEIETTG